MQNQRNHDRKHEGFIAPSLVSNPGSIPAQVYKYFQNFFFVEFV